MRWMLVMAATLLGCSSAPVEKPKTAEGADPAKARLLVNEAKNELESEKFPEARKLLDEANRYSDVEVRHQIELTKQAIDKGEANKVGKDANAIAKDGRCSEAIEKVAAIISARPDTAVPKRLRSNTADELTKCVKGLLDGDKLADAQRVIASDAAKTVFTSKRLKSVSETVHDDVVSKLQDRIAPSMGERNWAAASSALAKAVKDGELLAAERDELLTEVRAGLAVDVETLVDVNFGAKKGADKGLAQVDELLKAGFYLPALEAAEEEEKKTGGSDSRMAALLGGKGDKPAEKASDKDPNGPTERVPAKLNNLRRELAMWVICQQVGCRVKVTKQAWLYGNTALTPPFAPKDAPLRKLLHGRSVWRIADTGDNALIARKAPGNLANLRDRAHVSWGWVPSSALRWQDTSEWLPPGQAIVGTRVWGPLREGDKTYELGKVVGDEGNAVQVQRLADRDIMAVSRSALHFGVVKKGLKVLAFCEATKQQTATVESVEIVKHETQGESRATVRCLDASGKAGEERSVNFGALRIKPEWLPRRR